jgi:2,3-dihydroxyphenylpropionate 1,2-dioxygenase
MATIVFGGAMSHSPMMNLPIPKNHDQVERFKAAVSQLGSRLHEVNLDALVIFGPDHFRALFYDLMPAFVIGIDHLSGWGDWNTPTGPFSSSPDLARHILSTTLAAGFDPAFSHDLKVDHGITQPLQLLELTRLPLVPIIVNSAGVPLPTPRRCHDFGVAVGRSIASFPGNLRVAIVASGGLSHDPLAPSPENTLHGRTNGFASNRERETILMKNADTLQSRINREWDRSVLDHFERGNVAKFASQMTTESIFEAGGKGAQEVRTWIAMAGALGDPTMRVLSYEPIEALITGMGVIAT